MIENFVYPVALRALEKWKSNNLEEMPSPNGVKHFRFLFNGSTCNNGGTPFVAFLHVEIDSKDEDLMVRRAWIEVPEDQLESAKEMCTYRSSGEEFFQSLADFPLYKDRNITAILSEEVEENHAGCFCTTPMVNQKWSMAFSTIHFALTEDAGA